MDGAEAEDTSYVAVLAERFARKLDRADDAVEKRIKEERRAGMTEAEKGRRKGPPKLQFNVRATKDTRDLADALAAHKQLSLSDLIAVAIEELAKVTPGFKRGHQQ